MVRGGYQRTRRGKLPRQDFCHRLTQAAAAAAAAPRESFSYFPEWFVHTWSNTGWTGLWSRGLTLINSSTSTTSTATKANQAAETAAPEELAQGHSDDGEWVLPRPVSVLAHFVHCPGGPSNKITVKIANRR